MMAGKKSYFLENSLSVTEDNHEFLQSVEQKNSEISQTIKIIGKIRQTIEEKNHEFHQSIV